MTTPSTPSFPSGRSRRRHRELHDTGDSSRLASHHTQSDHQPTPIPRRTRKNQHSTTNSPSIVSQPSNPDTPLAGFVRQVNLVNFLTHDNLVVKLIPKINFINGANGSGKSAVLASIMIALGARATNTGRGQKITGLIQDNKTYCSITVHLANEGDNAYKPQIYGHTIIVTRRITKTGSSSYSIRNMNNVEISKLRRELSSITDHFNIQVDNSLTWLTQDSAKEFLMNVKDSDLYRFFAQGADILETRETYRVMGEELAGLCNKLQLITDSLETLKQKRMDTKIVQRELEAAEKAEKQLVALTTELDWCQIAQMESVIHQLQVKRNDEVNLVDQALSAVADEEKRVQDAIESLEQAQRDAQSNFNAQDLDEAESKLGPARSNRSMAMTDLESIKAEIHRTRESLKRAKVQLADMESRVSKAGQEDRARKIHRVRSIKTKLEESQKRIDEIDDEVRHINQQQPSLKHRDESLMNKEEILSSQISNLQHRITAITQARVSKINVWGNNMVNLLDAIDKTRWRGDKPIGPLGKYVIPKEQYRSVWLQYLRATVGTAMSDFVVSNVDDRKTLQQLFARYQQRNSRILITNMRQELQLDGYLPDASFLTTLDTLEITHPVVKRVLIVNQQIEQRILVEDRREAEYITRHGFPPNSQGVYLPTGYQVGTRSGALGMTAGNKWTGHMCPFGLDDVTTDDSNTNDPNLLNEQVNQLKQEQEQTKYEREQVRSDILQLHNRQRTLHQERVLLDRQRRPLEREMTQLEEAIEVEEPIELASIQDKVQQLMESLAVYEAQLPAAEEAVQEATLSFKEAEKRVADLKKMRDEARNYAAQKQAAIVTAERVVADLQARVEHYRERVKRHEELVKLVDNQMTEQQEELDGAIEEMSKAGLHRPGIIRTREEIMTIQRNGQAQISAIRERHNGIDITTATYRAEEAKNKYTQAKNEISTLQGVANRLRDTLHSRATSFSMLVHSISRMAKHSFRQHMAKRGFAANLTFDHENGLLHVVANALDENANRAIRTYSGGEKSFSTVCLLLALWDAIPSPIRALDEFDVFQDEVNRRVTMELLVEAAKKSTSQFILITPLNLANLAQQDDRDVSIVYLPAPQRNNIL